MLSSTDEDRSSQMLSVAGVQKKLPASRRKPACAAAAALASVGEKASAALPSLVAHLTSQDNEMRAECALAVGNMGVAAAKFEDKLSALLDDRQPMVVAAACTALGSLAH